jgi:hypothetical protein
MTKESKVSFNPDLIDDTDAARAHAWFSQFEKIKPEVVELSKSLTNLLIKKNVAYYEGDTTFISVFAFAERLQYLLDTFLLDTQQNTATMQLILDDPDSRILQELSDQINSANIEGLTATLQEGTLTVEVQLNQPTSSQQE